MTKINRINQILGNSLEKLASHGGEKMGNYVNAAGKFAIAPAVILYNPLTKEPKENREWAAIKQPIEAIVTLGLQLIGLKYLYKGIDKLAASGKIKFKLVENAVKKNEFPDKFIKKSLPKEEAVNELDKECLGILKDRIGTLLTIGLYVPTLAVTNKIFPIIANKVVKDESK